MALVNSPNALRFLEIMGTNAGRNAFMGSAEDLPSVPSGVLASLHRSVGTAVDRVKALEWDKTRLPPQKHHAAKKLADAALAEIQKARADLKSWAERETAAAMAEVEHKLEPEGGMAEAVVRSEIRTFVRSSLSGDAAANFAAQLRGLVETDKRFADAILEAPAALCGLTPERHASLRVDAAAAYAPEASMRVKVARDVAGLDAKLASVAAELPGSFYDLKIAAGMATRVNTDSLAE